MQAFEEMRQKTIKRLLVSCVSYLWLSLPIEARSQVLTTEFYSEQGYLTKDSTLISSLRVRENMPLGFYLKPFLQIGTERDSFYYFGPGLTLKMDKLTAIFEWRERGLYRITSNGIERELRASLVYNQQWFWGLKKYWDVFQEFYAEGVRTSSDENNNLLSGWSRTGLRQTVLSPLVLDFYLEPFFSTDSLGRAYNRRVELRPSLRAHYQFSWAYIAASGAYVISEQGSGLRFLAVLGGEV